MNIYDDVKSSNYPYDDPADQTQTPDLTSTIQAESVLGEAFKVDPVQHAKITQLSKASGIPSFAVKGKEKQIETLNKLRNLTFDGTPVTKSFYENYDNAAVAQNDIEKLKAVETALSQNKQGGLRSVDAFMRGGSRFAENFWRKIYRQETYNVQDILLADDATIEASFNAVKQNSVELGGNGLLAPLLKDVPLSDRQEFINNLTVSDYKSALVSRLNNLQQLSYASLQRSKDDAEKYGQTGDYTIDKVFNDPGIKNITGFVLETGIESIPEMLSAISGAGLIPVGISTSGRVAESRAQNNNAVVPTRGDDMVGNFVAPVIVALEKLGLEKALLKTGGFEKLKDVPIELLKRVFVEGSTESLQEVVEQIGGSAGTLTGVTSKDLIQAGAGGFLGGAGASTVINSVKAPFEITDIVMSKQKQVEDEKTSSEREQQKIDSIVNVVNEMQLKQLNPEALRQFVKDSDGDQNTTVFIKSDTLREYMGSLDQNEIDSDPALITLNSKLKEALALNTDIDIPIDEFVNDFIGSDHFDQLRPQMTLKSETPSTAQLEESRVQAQDYLSGLINEASQNIDDSNQAQQIYESVKDQLVDTGRLSERDAKIAAQLVPAWATAFAKQNGISIEEAFSRAGLTIQGPSTGKKQALKAEGVLTQDANGYYDDQNATIILTENANSSTFIHEFAHFVYDMERRASGQQLSTINQWYTRNAEMIANEASVSIDAVNKYLSDNTTGDIDTDKEIYRVTHEHFARGFETYLMEGVAPSIELRNVFRTIARWMVEVYRSIKGDLDVKIDNEMRGVFDRLLATEEQIAAAKARIEFEPLFTDAAMAGKTEEEYARYKAAKEKVTEKATETLRDKVIKQLTRENEAWWKQQKDDYIVEESKKLENERVYKTRNALTNGTIQLSTPEIRELLDIPKGALPTKLNKMRSPDGMPLDQAATALGYGSGGEMISDLIDSPTLLDAAREAAQKRMLNEHGDILNDGTIDQLADEALQNEEHGRLILSELATLAKLSNKKNPINRKMIKALAEENIAKLSYIQMHPAKYRTAEIKAAKAAATAFQKNDTDGAMVAKVRQVMNYYLGMEATKAKHRIEKSVEHKARYNKKSVREEIQKGDDGHLDQIDNILSRFEFRKSVSIKALEKTLAEFIYERDLHYGETIQSSKYAIDEGNKTHWKNVAYNDLMGVDDTVKSLEYVAINAGKIKLGEETVEFNKTINQFIDHLGKLKTIFDVRNTATPSQIADTQGFIKSILFKVKNLREKYLSELSKMPWVASWLDNYERAGLAHELLIQPMVDGYHRVQELHNDVSEPISALIKKMPKKDLKRYNKMYSVPEVANDTNRGNLHGMNILSIMLNMGNESNLRKLLLGEGWANKDDATTITQYNDKLRAILKKFKPTKADWDLVQAILDNTDKLYQPMADTYESESGLPAPPKIKASPIETEFGTYRGGFYPIKYDGNRSVDAAHDIAKEEALLESSFSMTGSLNASVNASTTNERTGYYKPINLNLAVLDRHIKETIHYIGLAPAVRQVNRIISDKQVSKLLKEKLGEHEFSQLKPWLRRIAKDGNNLPSAFENATVFNDSFGVLRRGMTFTYLGFKATTGLMQIAGLSNTIAETGGANTVGALKTTFFENGKNPFDSARNSFNKAIELGSKVLPNRVKTFDREISEARRLLVGQTGIKAAVQRASMWHIGFMQLYGVDIITWYSAYNKELVNSGNQTKAVRYADWAVENIQGSSTMFNLSSFQSSKNEMLRTYYAFSTFAATQLNQQRDVIRRYGDGNLSIAGLAGMMAFIVMMPTIYESWIKGLFSQDEDKAKTLAWRMVDTTLMGLPFVRDVSSVAQGYKLTTPAMNILASGAESSIKLLSGDASISDIKKSSLLAMTLLNIPGGSQAWVSGQTLYDFAADGEDMTMAELFMTGPKK